MLATSQNASKAKSLLLRLRLRRASLVSAACLSGIVALCLLLRLSPLKYGVYLYGQDPWYHLRVAEYIARNGFSSYLSWRDALSWYPTGREVASTTYMGLPLLAALTYSLLTSLGVSCSMLEVCAAIPMGLAAISCVAAYLLGRELGGETAGLFSALLMAGSPIHVSRSGFGGFFHEALGIPLIVLLLYSFAKSLGGSRSPYLFSAVASLSLLYLTISWGAFYIAYATLWLCCVAIAAAGWVACRNLLPHYCISVAPGLIVGALLPKPSVVGVAPAAVIAASAIPIAYLFEWLSRRGVSKRALAVLASVMVAASLLSAFLLSGELPAKFYYVINPAARMDDPIASSVADYQLPTWLTFYGGFHVSALLALLGAYYCVREASPQRALVLLYFVPATYLAGSMLRLSHLLVPAVCVLAGLALSKLLNPMLLSIRLRSAPKRNRARAGARLRTGPSTLGALAVLSLICWSLSAEVCFPAISAAVGGIYPEPPPPPPDILSGGVPVQIGGRWYAESDWPDALNWMRENLSEDAVVLTWWDSGYWVAAIAHRKTVVDNATLQSDRIRDIAKIYLSTEEELASNGLLQKYGITHVVVYGTPELWMGVAPPYMLGDEAKWISMARIAGYSDAEIVGMISQNPRLMRLWLPREDTVLMKLILFGLYQHSPPLYRYVIGVEEPPSLKIFKLVYCSKSGHVFIYRVVSGETA